jgi:hypothetical protein
LGDGAVPALAEEKDPDEYTQHEHPGTGAVHRGWRPQRDHVFGQGKHHRAILADLARARSRPLWASIESETTMMLASVSLSPSTSDLPGGAALQSLADGIAAWALIGALVALLLGAMLWAIGSHTQNMHQSSQGRRAVLTSLVAAILIGAAPTLINFFFNTGLSVH